MNTTDHLSCSQGVQIDQSNVKTLNYLQNPKYMDIGHPFMWQKALDNACVGGGADYFVRPNCNSNSFRVFQDIECKIEVTMPFDIELPKISCTIPNSIEKSAVVPTPSDLHVQFRNRNCTGSILATWKQETGPLVCNNGLRTISNITQSNTLSTMRFHTAGSVQASFMERMCIPLGHFSPAVYYIRGDCNTSTLQFFQDELCSTLPQEPLMPTPFPLFN